MATNNAVNIKGPTPAFMVTSNADQANVTGDNSIYDVQFPNTIYDTTSGFSGTTYTAPQSGIYSFGFNFYFNGIDTSMTNCLIYMTTTSATYRFMQQNYASGESVAGGINVISYYIDAPMTAGDTAKISVRFIGSGKTVSISGATSSGVRTPLFTGHLIIAI
jgi:hypothetical protein